MPWGINLSLKKYTFCDNWTKIVAQNWFGARIYPRALTLGPWPLYFRIIILKYIFPLVFVKKIYPNQTNGSKDNWGQTRDRQTDRQQTDNRQTFLSWPPSIWEILIFFFFFAYGRERMNGVKFIPPCLLRKFASLTCSTRRGKNTFRDFFCHISAIFVFFFSLVCIDYLFLKSDLQTVFILLMWAPDSKFFCIRQNSLRLTPLVFWMN
jgi:hypothetical protein